VRLSLPDRSRREIITRRAGTISFALAPLLAALLVAPVAASDPVPLPASMAAVGDSITQAASTGGSLGVDAPHNSWSTGTSATVNSHAQRLIAAGAPMGAVLNLSVSGAKVADLPAQMAAAAAHAPDYLTVLIGGNDVCTPTEGAMTSVPDFHAHFAAAMAALRSQGGANTRVYVVSIPRVMGLWELFHGNWWARVVWSAGNVCQSLLANPTSTLQADVDRRARVDRRNREFNDVLAAVCAADALCRWDGYAVFNTPFVASDVSGDYFHPSVNGQAKLAAVTWAAGYAWAVPNRPPVASFAASCSGLACTLTSTSTDADGTITGVSWDYGGAGTVTTAGYAYAAAGTYSVTLTVTDDDGASASATQTVTVSEPPTRMRVSNLTSSTSRTSSSWRATVTITVLRDDGVALSGARVSATWSRGAADTCTTGTDGRCSVTSDSFSRRSVSSVTMTVSGVTHTTLIWDQAASVRSITVQRPA
jgi:PKD repeat protein/lysophospholipase L1-like esterase